ncbi:MAG: toxin ParE1/3/4 [Alteromonadaceae bacterium]|jgi:toxin ParE1/3/4
MSSYILFHLAEEDLFKIISTTIESWGSSQAKVYAQYSDFGRKINDIYNGARRFPVEKHIVFY